MGVRQITAAQVKAGDVVLLDPLDERTAVDVADVERSQWTQATRLTMVRDGHLFLTADLSNSQLVTVV